MGLKGRLLCAAATALVCGSSVLLATGAATAAGAGGAAGGGAPGGGRFTPAPLPAGRARALGGTVHALTQVGSYNWSGYAQSGPKKTYKSVTDFWTVPTVKTSDSGDQYSSDWVGIGGIAKGDKTLVQAGTEADNLDGTAYYAAWTEILPAAEVAIPGLTIHAGDRMQATVASVGKDKFAMTVDDLTTGVSGGRTVAYKSKGESVEAIHERPCIADGCTSLSDLANLTQTTDVTFDPGSYGNGSTPTTGLLVPATKAKLYQIFMTDNTGSTIIASPSSPDSDNDGFTVADGSTSPPPPKS